MAKLGTCLIHGFFILFSLTFLLPFIMVLSTSLSSEQDLAQYGFRLFPASLDFGAYSTIFAKPDVVIKAYVVTAFQALATTALAVIIMSMCAYALSRTNFRFRKAMMFFIFFTMLFSGGLIPKYILNTQYYQLADNIWVYVLPVLASAFHIIIFRTFFQGISEGIIESAKIDGAGELRIYWQIVAPLSKPVFATLGLLILLDRWNDWFTSLLYIRNPDLYTLQYLLQRILREAEFIRQMALDMSLAGGMDMMALDVPTESFRFAMAVVAAGPLLLVFPFFQKYFARGLTIGAVKG